MTERSNAGLPELRGMVACTAGPHPARVYAYWCGGKDHYLIDRLAGDRIAETAPWVVAGARANRAFLNRAVTALAREGIDQFIEIGCGLPTSTNVHEVAQRVAPNARVVYVDNDDVVLAHARAILAADPGVAVVAGDAQEPAEILNHPRTRAHLDLTRPVAVLLVAVLHFVIDDRRASAALSTLRECLVPGSCLAVSHVSAPVTSPKGRGRPDPRDVATREAAQLYDDLIGPFRVRTREQVAGLLDGWALLDPGLTDVDSWRRLPGRRRIPVPVLAGVGRLAAP